MRITILTLFPEFFDSFKTNSIIGRAISRENVELNFVNIRDFSLDKTHRVDDRPIGGGAGLVMRLEPLLGALNSVKTASSHVILLTPSGKQFKQKKAQELAKMEDVILVCGHYEGVDRRFEDYVDECLSIGDFVLTGGEIGAMAIADSIIRLLDGVISPDSILEESFSNPNFLEYPQYTFPVVYDGKEVPDILLTGNHQAVSRFRQKEAIKRTLEKRPDLLENYQWSKKELVLLDEIKNNSLSKLEKNALEKGKKFIKK